MNIPSCFIFRHGHRFARLLTLGLALAWPISGQASGGGGYSELVSYARVQPEPAATAGFLQGQLGILWPSTDRFYLMAAYRIMQGLPALSEQEQTRLLQAAALPRDEKHPPAGAEQWLQQRNAVASAVLANSPNEGYLERGNYTYAPNCMPEAFEFAAATLAKRQATMPGQDRAWLQAWISNQDGVFASCDLREKPVPVLALPAGAPQWLQHDFAYQQAAQLLYLGKYSNAAQAFAIIAKDTASPWREWASYLAIRAWWRESFRSAEDYQHFRDEAGPWPQHEQAQGLQRIIQTARDASVRKAARGKSENIRFRHARKSSGGRHSC